MSEDRIICINIWSRISFNIKGRPILTTYADAFHVLKETQLDFLVTEDFIIEK